MFREVEWVNNYGFSEYKKGRMFAYTFLKKLEKELEDKP